VRHAPPRRARLALALGLPVAAAAIGVPAAAPARSMTETIGNQPQTSITEAPKWRTTERRARFAFASSEPGSAFQCRLDAAAFAPCGSRSTYRRLKPRKHAMRVRSVNGAGIPDRTPAIHRWRVVREHDPQPDVEGNDIPPPPGSPAAQFEKECAEHPVICD
jgi:hypothetical protein